MQKIIRALFLLVAMSVPLLAQAEIRTFREVNGRSHTGTFQKVQGDKVHLRVRNKTSMISFWSLSKDDQLYVLEQAKSDPLVASNLKAAEPPRDWIDSRGNKSMARFIEVKPGATVVLAIDGNKSEFPFENFSKTDQDYIRGQVLGTDAAKHLPEDTKPAGNPTPQPSQGVPPSALGQINIPQFVPGGIRSPSIPSAGHGAMPPSVPGVPNTPTFPAAGHAATPSGIPGSTFPTTSTTGSIPGHNATPPSPAPATSLPPTTNPTTPPMHAAAAPAPRAPTPPPSTTNRPTPFGSSDTVAVYRCSRCNKEVTNSATRCPHCSAQFDYVEDENGNRTSTTYGSSRNVGKALRAIVVIAVGIGGFLYRKLSSS